MPRNQLVKLRSGTVAEFSAADTRDGGATLADGEVAVVGNSLVRGDGSSTTVGLPRVGKSRLDIRDFGAVGDGVEDDSAAIIAAVTHAKTLVNTVYEEYDQVTIEFPNFGRSRYKITQTIPLWDGITYEGNGSILDVQISAYPVITTATAAAGATDVAAQTGGAAFADIDCLPPSTKTQISNVKVQNFFITGARWGILFMSNAVGPILEQIEFVNGNCAVHFYGGVQLSSLRNIEPNSGANVGVVGGAVCQVAAHPWKARDNNFLGGVRMFNDGHSVNLAYNPYFDDWFRDSILRPTSTESYRSNINFGVFDGVNPDAVNVSGRFAYFPGRSNSGSFGVFLDGCSPIGLARGLVYINHGNGCVIQNSLAEKFAVNTTLNALNPELNYIELNKPQSVSCNNIYTEYATAGADYNHTVEVKSRPNDAIVTATNIAGKMDPTQFYFVTYDNPYEASGMVAIGTARLNPRMDRSSWVATTPNIVTTTDPSARFMSISGDALDVSFVSSMLPRPGESQTTLTIWRDSLYPDVDTSWNFLGRLSVTVQDISTGDIDFGEYLVQSPGRYGSTTLSADATSGASTISVAQGTSQIVFHAGDQVTINATDKYLVKSALGSVITLASPLRASYTSGQTVVGTHAVTRTLVTPTNSWFAVSGVTSQGMRITNSRGAGSPIKVYAEMRMIQERNAFAL